MRKGRNTAVFVLFFLSAVFLCAVFLLRDTMIVRYGIHAYRAYRILGSILCAVLFFAALSVLVKGLEDGRKKKALEEEFERRKKEASKAPASLSVKGRLDSLKIRNLLEQKVSTEWIESSADGMECVSQMKQMDAYHEKLHALLSDNDAQVLSDSEDVLESAGQYMCRNIRKVLNYMSVADSSAPDDNEMIGIMLKKCGAQNGEQLKRVQEFVYAVTEYLNHQGEDDTNVEMLEIYKNTILGSIQEG